MKIMYVITKADIGGAQTHLIQLANYFSKKHKVIVAVGNDGPMIDAFNKEVQIIRLNHLKGPILFKEDILGVKELASIIRFIKPDILHLHSSKAGTLGRLASKLSKVKNIKVIFTAHSWAFTEGVQAVKRFIFKTIEKQLIQVTNKVICVSEYDKQLAIRNKFEIDKLQTIHNSVSKSKEDVLSRIKNIHIPPIKFVMVARFAYPKMHKEVIEAVNILNQSTDRLFEVTFIGDGDNIEECKALVQTLGLEQKIEFKGSIDNAQAILNQYHVFILMSKHEGLPISIIEAMAEGLPIIASNVGGINELVKDNGTLLNDNTPQELANAMAS